MKVLNQEILSYVTSKASYKLEGSVVRGRWSDSTVNSNYYKLSVALSCNLNPDLLYTKLSQEGCSLYTIQVYFIVARQFEKETRKTKHFEKWMQSHPAAFKNAYRKKEKLMTEEQFSDAVKRAEDHVSLYNFLILMGKAGLRKSEALDMVWGKIQDDYLEVAAGKGGKQRFVPFKKAWLKPTPTNTPVNQFNYWPFFKSIGFTPHDFRSYYATKIVNIAGMSIEDARDLLGHSDIKTTAKYLRVNKEKQSRLIMENFG